MALSYQRSVDLIYWMRYVSSDYNCFRGKKFDKILLPRRWRHIGRMPYTYSNTTLGINQFHNTHIIVFVQKSTITNCSIIFQNCLPHVRSNFAAGIEISSTQNDSLLAFNPENQLPCRIHLFHFISYLIITAEFRRRFEMYSARNKRNKSEGEKK